MSELRKILSTSTLSLLLVVWGLFMVCSGRVPDVSYEDDLLTSDDEFNGESNSDLMTQLATLDDESTKLEDYQRKEILEALGISPTGSSLASPEEEDFLTEELFLDLEVEIAELEKLAGKKNQVVDSLKLELQEADMQLAALGKIVEQPAAATRFASRAPATSLPPMPISNSDYALSYQNALEDVYAHRFTDAIAKFQSLLRMADTDNLADNCQYWIGEAYYALGKYQQSIAEFEKVFAFDNNNKTDDAQFMIGLAYIRMGESSLAQFELNNLLTFFQNSEYIARAEREMSGLNI